MTEQIYHRQKEELALKTLLHYLDKYVIKSSNPFTSDMFALKQVDIGQLNQQYNDYLNGNGELAATWINTLLQQKALSKNAREHTNNPNGEIKIDDYDFQKICQAAETLRLVCDDPAQLSNQQYDIIMIPGGLQTGVLVRMNTLKCYLKKHPDFAKKGQVFLFGANDRPLLPYTLQGKVKEGLTFAIIAKKLNSACQDTKHTYTNASVKKMLDQVFNTLSSDYKKTETSIALTLAEELPIDWPTEHQLIVWLTNRFLLGYLSNFTTNSTERKDKNTTPSDQCDTKKEKKSEQIAKQFAKRATTEDEAQYMAQMVFLKAQTPTPSIGVITNFAYQEKTYHKYILQKCPNARIEMLSPYKNIHEYIENSVKKKAQRDGLNVNDGNKIRLIVFQNILDSLARYFYSSQVPMCPLVQNASRKKIQQDKCNDKT